MGLSLEETKYLTGRRWFVLTASCLINLCVGSMYAWSVFATPMAAYLNELNGLVGDAALTPSALAVVFVVTNVVGPIMTLCGGYLHDTLGPKKMIFIGGLIYGGAMILSGFATSLTFLMLSYGAGIGIGNGFVYICTISNSVKFFPDKRGLIGGLVTATYGLGSVIMPPIANALITSAGVLDAFRFIGIAFIIIICGCSFLVLKCPAGFTPEGWTPPAPAPSQLRTDGTVDRNWKEMLADKIFYVMLFMLSCGAVSGLMIISQASSVAQNMVGMSRAAAASAVSALALFNAAGRVSAGYLSDKLGRVNTLTFMLGLSIIGLGTLYLTGSGSVGQFYVGVSIVGVCFGSFMGVYPGFTADQFGPKHSGFNYGIMFIGFGVAGILGPNIMTKTFASTGDYQLSFMISAGLAALGIVISFVYRAMSKAKTA
ncbi:MAG: OFA family MFS transporter [Synergistaceae bacterium]|jgi:MFS family permease|nr:OFA family MFS transporter [Synergistaceae bacterium]